MKTTKMITAIIFLLLITGCGNSKINEETEDSSTNNSQVEETGDAETDQLGEELENMDSLEEELDLGELDDLDFELDDFDW